MSLLREVIDIVGENDIANARASLKKLLKQLKAFQSETRQYIEENHTDYVSTQANNDVYLQQAEQLTAEVNDLIQNIENETKNDILSIAEDVQQYLSEMDELRIGLQVNKRILKINSLFIQLDESKNNNEFIHIRRLINELKEIIHNPEDEDVFKRLDCYKNIKIRWHIENELLLNTLQQRFDALVQLTEKTFQNTKVATMKISKDDEMLKDILAMLFNSNFNIQRICTFLMDNIFEPIITKPVCLNYDENQSLLTLSFSLKPIVVQAENLNLRPNYIVVFNHIREVFKFLSDLNIKFSDDLCVFSILANNIKENFCKILINDCLTYAIPDTMDDMNVSTLATDIVEFHQFLCAMSILKETETADQKLIEFSERVDVIFKKRFCLNIQKNAIQIMQRDLHDMQLVEEKQTDGQFPKCMVSKSTFELIELMENVLKEAIESTRLASSTNGSIDTYVIDDIHDRLSSTIPMILERYTSEIVNVHGKILQVLPQQTALFHNNCIYLAWWFSKQTSASTSERNTSIVAELQELGSKQFALQIKAQRTQLLDILREFDLTECVTELGTQPFKSVRQCLRQLDLLQNVWEDILPDMVYNKSLGTVVNDICSEVTRKIIAMEDISSSVANSLVEICDEFLDKAPQFFQDPLQISVNVKLWFKLQQLKMILNASMVHITEQWADGKGPLTLHYKADEVRHLIRALFQNTDRRANALATIV